LLLGALLATSCGQKNDASREGAVGVIAIDAQPAPAPAEPTPAPRAADQPIVRTIRYDETNAGLQSLMTDLLRAIAANDEPEIVQLVDSLRLPNYREWMRTTFGDSLGSALSDEYRPQVEEIGSLVDLLRLRQQQGQTSISVERFLSATAPQATGYQSEALKRMKRRTALYSVRMSSPDGSRVFHLWSFVHAEGSFRYVGKMRAVTEKKDVNGRDLNEYRIADAEKLGK
jgi:hypothetical protein